MHAHDGRWPSLLCNHCTCMTPARKANADGHAVAAGNPERARPGNGGGRAFAEDDHAQHLVLGHGAGCGAVPTT